MKKNFGFWVVALIFVLFWCLPFVFEFLEGSEDYVHLTALDYTATVVDQPGANGKVVITEQITFDINFSYRDYAELYRVLPEIPAAENDGAKVDYKVLSVERLTVDGSPAPLVFEESNKLYWYDNDYASGPNKWFHSDGPYDEEARRYESLLIYTDQVLHQEVVFEIKYEMHNASMRYGDCSELYLSVYSGEEIQDLKSLKAQFLFPNDKMPQMDNYIANTFGTDSHTFDFTLSATRNPGFFTFYFELNQQQLKFHPYNQYVEFSLVSHGADKHSFTQFASSNNYYNANVYDGLLKNQQEYFDLPQQYNTYKVIVFVAMLAVTSAIFVIVYFKNKKISSKHEFFRPEVDYPLYREIPSNLDPSFAAVLALCKHNMSDEAPGGYAAVMLSLVRKGYIEVEKIKPNTAWLAENTRVIVLNADQATKVDTLNSMADASLFEQQDDKKALTRTEWQYYSLIRKYATRGAIDLKELQHKVASDYESTEAFVKNTKSAVKNIGMSGGFFQRPDYKKLRSDAARATLPICSVGILIMLIANLVSAQTRLGLAFGGFFVLGIGLIVAAIWNRILARKYVLLTQFGENEYSKWRGLYNFLNDETQMKEHDVPQIAIWEEYLIYATAFGISEKIIKVLDVKFPEFNQTSSTIVHHPFLCRVAFTHTYSRAFRTSTHTASLASRTGISGGYGGGGRGGGGGGGGH